MSCNSPIGRQGDRGGHSDAMTTNLSSQSLATEGGDELVQCENVVRDALFQSLGTAVQNLSEDATPVILHTGKLAGNPFLGK